MQQTFITLGMLIGGLGLFLMAVNMITDGLKLAAGRMLKNILSRWTESSARGIVTGLTITAIVQSSSAVTVATIGFVNAGLISLYQALGVVYGTNIGTTMTAWLVAIIGFNIKVEIFALPLIGIGMLLKLTSSKTRLGSIGLALAGFGLFFMGIDVLKNAFEGIAATLEMQRFTIDGVAGVLLYFVIGFIMTVLTQSSSAAIAITLTAVTGGVLGLYAAAAMVIGANVGTTSTAGFAVIGATSNAKRVAAAHVIFNVATGIVALVTLPLLFLIVKTTGQVLGLEDIPAVTLALFHTTFNILGVLLMLPLTRKMTGFLETRFVTQEEIEGNPRYLDKNIAASPALAMNALALEISRMSTVVQRMAIAILSTESYIGRQIISDHMIVKKLANAIAEFISLLERGTLSADVARQMAKLLQAEQHLLTCADQAIDIAREQPNLIPLENKELIERVSRYRAEVVQLIHLANSQAEDFSLAACEVQLERVQASYDDTKRTLLLAGAELRTPIPGIIDTLEQNSQIRRMTRQMVKSIRSLSETVTGAEKQPLTENNSDDENTDNENTR
ncbi:MAG: Na/Pi symporter [Gammaproteobacteria bacterium]|nr:Na/Pi symporter [Gammaproteobacteria bacterium]MCW8986569.1 Na/Pi symporter [Gammaproteobacteria bacterium]MCW9031978.1 Na/Pi symporter [Gammaproteobacteria bacterium]